METIQEFSFNVENNNYCNYGEDIKDIEEMLNLEEEMLSSYSVVMYMNGKATHDFPIMAVHIINKNIHYIFSALQLTQVGQYAAARVLFRNIYESLIILKTVSITKNQGLLKKWFDGDNINLKRTIFRYIESPISVEMEELWIDLCRFCHGTIYSCQQITEYEYSKEKIMYNYILMKMLLFMNYHVLNRYVFSASMKAMVDRNIYLWDDPLTLKDKREILRSKMKEFKMKISKTPQRVLIDFTKVWKFKNL